jgi:hypothetical protein
MNKSKSPQGQVQLKDVLHFYLGCRIAIVDPDGQAYEDAVHAVIDDKGGKRFTIYECGDMPFENHEEYYQSARPILRPLSSMSDEEMDQFNRLTETLYNMADGVNMCMQYAAGVNYLLKQGFDLFGLIESGQAIDNTQTPNS